MLTNEPPAAHHIYLYTVGRGCGLLHAAARGDQPHIITHLIEQGADPNLRGGFDDQTPLHAAAWHDAPDAIEALVQGGADINLRSGEVHTNEPIGWAIVSGAVGAVSAFLNHGATLRDIHRQDATAGAAGEFQCFNRDRPLSDWTEISRIVEDH